MKIAILDSGINSSCIENPACIIDRKSFLLKDDSILIGSDCDDAFGHGTFCLQTIRRIAPDSEFICIKVLNDEGLTCAEVLIEALKSLLSADVDIINLSLSVTNPDYDDGELKQVCQMLYQQGKIIVSSVQNRFLTSVPASYDSVIGVLGAMTPEPDLIQLFSENAVDASADCFPVLVRKSPEQWDFFSGNSKSACIVTGWLANVMKQTASRDKAHLLTCLSRLQNVSISETAPKLPDSFEITGFLPAPAQCREDFSQFDLEFAEDFVSSVLHCQKSELWKTCLLDLGVPNPNCIANIILRIAEHENISVSLTGLSYHFFEWFAEILAYLESQSVITSLHIGVEK